MTVSISLYHRRDRSNHNMKVSIASAAFALALIHQSASAQNELFHVTGKTSGDRFGYSVAGIGDVSGDTVPDWVVGAPYDTPHGTMSGSARVISGASGTQLYEFEGNSSLDMFGYSVSGGDVDGDGLGDVIIGAYGDNSNGADSGSVFVYSGLDGALLHHLKGVAAGDNLGISVSYVPDTDGDGRGEILAGSWASDIGPMKNVGRARLYSGATGQQLHSVAGQAAYDLFGGAVAGLEDSDGDGFGDFIVGAHWNDQLGIGAGSAYVYSGSTGTLLRVLRGQVAGDAFGYAVGDAGDVDGDGKSDWIVGAPGADPSGSNSGSAQVFSSSNGALLYAFSGDLAGDSFGSAVAGNFDVDDDGLADLLIGAFAADGNGLSSGRVRVHAGSDGHVITTVDGLDAETRFGAAVAAGGDIDLDGKDELLVGAWGEYSGPGPFTGALYVLSFSDSPPLTSTYCISGHNSAALNAEIWYTGSTSISTSDFELTCDWAIPNQSGLFFYGQAQIEVPFGDGYRCVGGSIYRLGAALADSLGSVSLAVDFENPQVPAAEITAGSTWNFQYWYRDPVTLSGFNLSNALNATFVP